MHLFANFSSFTEALLGLFEAFGFLFVLVVQKPRYSMVVGFVNFLVFLGFGHQKARVSWWCGIRKGFLRVAGFFGLDLLGLG